MVRNLRKTILVYFCIISLILVTLPISSTSVNRTSHVKPQREAGSFLQDELELLVAKDLFVFFKKQGLFL